MRNFLLLGLRPSLCTPLLVLTYLGPFPFTISMRSSEEDMIVFDDLLSLTPCHLNVIPTDVYCADWRYLLLKPKEGLEVLMKMYNSALKVVKEQFIGNKEWGRKVLKNFDSLTVRYFFVIIMVLLLF